jgi:mono/diheme cytochrome c family protein
LQQLILSLRINNEASKLIVKSILEAHPDNEVIKITAAENLNPSFSVIQQLKEKYKLGGGDAAGQIVRGFKIFKEYCSTCHGADGKGIHQLAPSLVGSPRVMGDVEVPVRILLHGLTGPVDGVEYNGPMAPVSKENDQYIADVLSYVRTHLNGSGGIWFGRVRGIREKTKDRAKYWTLKELDADQKVRDAERAKADREKLKAESLKTNKSSK